MHLHVISRRASVSPAALQKHLQPHQGMDALAFSLVSLSGPDADECPSQHQRYCSPCPQAGFFCPEVPSAWQDALEFVFPVLLRD